MDSRVSRRTFVFGSALLLAGCATGTAKGPKKGVAKGPRRVSANEKLNIAGVGVGGQGHGDINGCKSENIVALCDVDWNQAAGTFKEYPSAKRYKDFRQMLEKEKDIDAVVISTPDHVHAFAAMAAMQLGKHVRVQKPLTHSVFEARKLAEAARLYKVASQMGNQGHANPGVRDLCEVIWSGVIGQIREVHAWTDRPIWPQNIDRPQGSDPAPDYLDWGLWLGPAPERPFVAKHPKSGKNCYCPFVWRGWWDFGCGALGDMGCHILDPANWALHLTAPSTVTATVVEGWNIETAPDASVVKYDFPERTNPKGSKLAPVALYWYDGKRKPVPPTESGITQEKLGGNGSFFVGEKGCIMCGCYGEDPVLLPKDQWADYKKPDPYIPRIEGGSYREWIRACKGGTPAGSNFDYAGPFTEWVVLGNLAIRAGGMIRWDSAKMEVIGDPVANALVKREYRKGWTL